MTFFIDVSDKRTKYLKQELTAKGFKTEELTFPIQTSKGDILIYAPNKKWKEEEIKLLPENIYLFCGNIAPEYQSVLKEKNITFVNLLLDEHFAVENAKLTAEGVLALMIEGTEKSIFENNVLILGAGRIAKSCAMLFTKLGIKFSIATFNKTEYENCFYYTNSNFYEYAFVDKISTFDIIINTRPMLFIDENIIKKIAPNTLFIETASIDCLDKEKVKNFTFLPAPGLPQKYSCISASKLMLTKILGELKMNTKIGFAITGSFCTHQAILTEMQNLTKKGYDLLPILTDSVVQTDTRFEKAKDFVEEVEKICGKKSINKIIDAEPIGPNNLIDLLVIAPCTGNTLAKLANSIADNAVTMTAKSLSRNNKPIVVGISSNDALGLNFKNLATLLNTKNFFFVPFTQDDDNKKPKSLVADWTLMDETIQKAISKEQLQPILKK